MIPSSNVMGLSQGTDFLISGDSGSSGKMARWAEAAFAAKYDKKKENYRSGH